MYHLDFSQIKPYLTGSIDDGMLLVDKPAGISSFGVVAIVRGAIRAEREHQEGQSVAVSRAGPGCQKEQEPAIRTEARSQERQSSATSAVHLHEPRLEGEGSATSATPSLEMPGLGLEGQNPTTPAASHRKPKVGHTGTLDPFATGLLILMIGKGTKRCQDFLKLDKWYEAELRLGISSTTGDPEGELIPGSAAEALRASQLSTEEVRTAMSGLTGEIWQTVPQFSAVKISGQRAYDLARRGQVVEMPRRKVEVYQWELLGLDNSPEFSNNSDLARWSSSSGQGILSDGEISNGQGSQQLLATTPAPTLRFRCHVSSGTYVRTLGEDLAKQLGTVGYLTSLRRLAIGKYRVEDALPVPTR